jgi:hypothetical protein
MCSNIFAEGVRGHSLESPSVSLFARVPTAE